MHQFPQLRQFEKQTSHCYLCIIEDTKIANFSIETKYITKYIFHPFEVIERLNDKFFIHKPTLYCCTFYSIQMCSIPFLYIGLKIYEQRRVVLLVHKITESIVSFTHAATFYMQNSPHPNIFSSMQTSFHMKLLLLLAL